MSARIIDKYLEDSCAEWKKKGSCRREAESDLAVSAEMKNKLVSGAPAGLFGTGVVSKIRKTSPSDDQNGQLRSKLSSGITLKAIPVR
jgi:hypothetical protein